jgi:hypothetical protein
MTTIRIEIDGKDDGAAVRVLWNILRAMEDRLRSVNPSLWPVYSIGTGGPNGSGTATVERVDAASKWKGGAK